MYLAAVTGDFNVNCVVESADRPRRPADCPGRSADLRFLPACCRVIALKRTAAPTAMPAAVTGTILSVKIMQNHAFFCH